MADTKLLLHLDGADGATATDDSSSYSHSITFNGTAQLDTAQKKFGDSSLLLDGNSDYLTVPYSSGFDLFDGNHTNATVDFWARKDDNNDYQISISLYKSAGERWAFRFNNNESLYFFVQQTDVALSGPVQTTGVWHHFAVIKVGNDYGLYVNGTQVAYDSSTQSYTYGGTSTLYVGQKGNSDHYYKGWLDEIKLSDENHFNASPNVGLTDTITVPTEAYSEDSVHIPSQGIIVI